MIQLRLNKKKRSESSHQISTQNSINHSNSYCSRSLSTSSVQSKNTKFLKKSIEKNNSYEPLIPIIKDKMEIVYWMLRANISDAKFSSLQDLIDNISDNKNLELFKHKSKSSFKEFAKCFNEAAKEHLQKEIKKYKYYSLLIDDSTNIKRKNMMSVYIRYISSELKPITKFLSVKEIGEKGATSENLFNILTDVVNDWGLDLRYMVYFTSDGASNMQLLFKLLKQQSPDAVWTHCACHKLNLVMKSSTSGPSVQRLSKTKQTLNKIVKFINGSSNRICLFESAQKKILHSTHIYQLQQDIEIRWCSFYASIHSIVKTIPALKLVISSEHEKEKTELLETIHDALNNIETLSDISVLDVILGCVNTTMKKFQEINISIGTITKHLSDLIVELRKLQNGNKPFELLKNLIVGSNIDANLIKEQEPHTQILFSKYIDSIIANINTRFASTIIDSFTKIFDPVFLKNLDEAGWNNLEHEYFILVEHFKNRFTSQRFSELKNDWSVFKKEIKNKLKIIYKMDDLSTSIIQSHRYKDMVTLIRMAHFSLIIPPTSVAVESGFSVLSYVMPKIRNRMGNELLNLLMMIQINFLDNKKIINDILYEAAIKWLSKTKRRKGLKSLIRKLYKEGHTSLKQSYSSLRWRESKEEIDSDECSSSEDYSLSACINTLSEEDKCGLEESPEKIGFQIKQNLIFQSDQSEEDDGGQKTKVVTSSELKKRKRKRSTSNKFKAEEEIDEEYRE
jgi:hypothetical protein